MVHRSTESKAMKSLPDALAPIQNLNIVRDILPETGSFPNNPLLPLLVYRQALQAIDSDSADLVREILETNSWKDSWVDGIYDYHHYHSTAHETLVIINGSAIVQFGGPDGIAVPIERGDVVIIPAGVAHKKVEDADGFLCLGAYPQGQHYDMNYGKEGERPRVDGNIRNVPLPENDPLYGNDGPLIKNWSARQSGISPL